MSTGVVLRRRGRRDRRPLAWRPGPVAQAAADVEAVELAGEPDVHDDQLRVLAGDQLEPGLAVVGLQDPEPVAAQVHGHQVGDVVIVLDHHHGVLVGGHRTSLPPPRRGRRQP